jgi:hypothetical protein
VPYLPSAKSLPYTTYTKGHGGLHACYCGARWDEEGKISVKGTPRRR